ncbi:MAG: hypothetical protein NTX07_04415 [Solirubrobacterales bacterium]|nr:hypothetical protein [Solirubrobacterales bacterium]
MIYENSIAFRQALEDRLTNLAAETSVPLPRLRKLVAKVAAKFLHEQLAAVSAKVVA